MKSEAKIIDAFQIIGFGISALVSIVLILAKQDEIASVTLGFVLAVLIQLFDVQLRQANAEDRLLKANMLSKKLYKDEWLLQRIQQIIEDYYTVKDHWLDLFRHRANGTIMECNHVLHSLAEGEMVVTPLGSFDLVFGGVKSALSSIKSVTYEWDWWRSTRSEKYLEENVIAIRRDVEVSRIFIVSREKLKDVVDILRKHQSKGIKVSVVYTEELPREYNESFTIIDGTVVVLREKTGDERSRERCISTKSLSENP